MKTKTLNLLLLFSFVITIMVPLTGIIIHKMASTLFLILSLIHTFCYRKRLDKRKYAALGLVFIAFVSGVFGLIFEEIPLILAIHKVISVACVFFLAIHIFVFYKRMNLFKKVPFGKALS